METFVRTYRGAVIEHPIYTRDEADEQKLSYQYWKDADEDTFWVLTDDGYVCELLKFRRYLNRAHKAEFPWLMLPFCKVFVGKRQWDRKLRWELYRAGDKSPHSIIHPKERDWVKQEAGTTRLKQAVKVYVAQLIAGVPVDWKGVGLAYRQDQLIPEASIRRVFKQEAIQRMIREELLQVYKDKGLDEAFVVDTLLEAKELARFKNNALAMIKVAEVGRDLLEMNPTQTKTRQLEQWDYKDENRALTARVQRMIETGNAVTEATHPEGTDAE